MTDLSSRLRKTGLSHVADDAVTRAMYSTDASLYRLPPQAVAFPRGADEVAAACEVAREMGVPVTARGAGTSAAGNAVGSGLVVDFSRHMNRVLSVDAESRSAVVQPGVIQAALQVAAAPHGCTLGRTRRRQRGARSAG